MTPLSGRGLLRICGPPRRSGKSCGLPVGAHRMGRSSATFGPADCQKWVVYAPVRECDADRFAARGQIFRKA